MDQGWVWGVLSAIAILVAGSMIGFAPAAIDRTAKSGWWLVILSPFPLVVWNVLWVIMANPPDSARRLISIVIGALAGAVILFGLTELLHGPAEAQQPNAGAPSAPPSLPAQQNNQGPGQQFNAPITTLNINPAPAVPQIPARDPDGVYQFNRKVGRVVAFRPDDGNGIVTFDRIFGEEPFNKDADFDYRDYILHIVNKQADGENNLGGQVSRYLWFVTCKIVGRLPQH